MFSSRRLVTGWMQVGMLIATLAGVGCASGLAARSETAAQGAAKVTSDAAPIAQLKLSPLRVRLRTVQADAGAGKGTFLFDTGAGITMISPDTARKIGCEPWGRLSGFRMFGDRVDMPQCNNVDLEIDGFKFHAPVVGVFDPSPYLAKDAEPVAGVIALDLFADRAITIDLVRNLLTIESAGSLAARVNGMHEGQLRVGREIQGAALNVQVAVPTAKGDAWFELDTGNGGTILIGKHIAPLLGLEAEKKEAQQGRFPVTGGGAVDHEVRVLDLIVDGNLGMPFMSGQLMTLDLAHAKVWMAPARESTASTP